MIYDLHAHAIVPEALREMSASHPDHAPSLVEDDGVMHLSYVGRARLGPLPFGMFDPSRRLQDMSAQRVDLQVLAIPPSNYFYHLPAEVGIDFAHIQNDHLRSLCDSYPDSFHMFGTLPLQDVDESLRELGRISNFSLLRGVQIGTNINGMDLDNPRFQPLWAELQALNIPAWMHADQRSVAMVERLDAYYLQNLIGQPLESTIAMAKLIFGGVMERHPALRVGWVHGGGFAPYQIGRWNHGWSRRSEPRIMIDSMPPDHYFQRMYFDSLTHDALSLEMLGRRVGWDHVVLGSDYPFDMSSPDPIGGFEGVDISLEDRRRVFEGNAAAFLRPLA